jgi:hypothetical protein
MVNSSNEHPPTANSQRAMAVSVSGQSECADKQRISRAFEIAALSGTGPEARDNYVRSTREAPRCAEAGAVM